MTGKQNRTISKDGIHSILVNLVLTTAGQAVLKGLENEEWIIDRLIDVQEDYDHLIPGVKAYVDLPWVDELQARGTRELFRVAVRRAYSYAQAHGLLPAKVSKAPEVELTEEDRGVADSLGLDPAKMQPVAPQPNPQPSPSAPPVPDQSNPQEGDDENTGPDYPAIAADYKDPNSSWYKFPPEGKTELTDGDTPISKNGLDAAIEYLKTRDDLVYE